MYRMDYLKKVQHFVFLFEYSMRRKTEFYCDSVASGNFVSSRCVNVSKWCDSRQDCNDSSDERNCYTGSKEANIFG